MLIEVSRYGGPLGSFSQEEVREGLRTGQFLPTDTGRTEAMAEPKPLADFPQLSAAEPSAEAPPPPVQTTAGAVGETSAGASTSMDAVVGATGLPWENRADRGLFEAFFQTVIMVLTKPAEAFDRMRKEGGMWDPALFALIGGSTGLFVSLLFSLGMNTVGMAAGRHGAFGALLGLGFGSAFLLVLVPIFVLVGVFVGAAIVHVCLLLVGGASRSFETTFRVICFTNGSAHLLMLVPLCGGMISGVWGLVVNCIGLARAHQTDTWRAVLAVFLPMIVCCGGIILFAIFFGTLGALGLGWHGHH